MSPRASFRRRVAAAAAAAAGSEGRAALVLPLPFPKCETTLELAWATTGYYSRLPNIPCPCSLYTSLAVQRSSLLNRRKDLINGIRVRRLDGLFEYLMIQPPKSHTPHPSVALPRLPERLHAKCGCYPGLLNAMRTSAAPSRLRTGQQTVRFSNAQRDKQIVPPKTPRHARMIIDVPA